MEINGSIVIVTGASSGIGAAAAQALARRGATVVLAARRLEELQTLAQTIERAGGRALVVPCDVSQHSDIERLAQITVDTYGRIDVLVNNAGINAGYTAANVSDDYLQRIVAVNLLGPIRCARAVIPHMQRQGGGLIINIGSIAGEVATNSLYSATKFGLRGLTDALRRELRHDRISVVLIAPGFIRTPLTKGLKLPMPGPEVVAETIARMIERPRRRAIVPWPYGPVMYLAKLCPWLADLIIGSRSFQRSYRERKTRM